MSYLKQLGIEGYPTTSDGKMHSHERAMHASILTGTPLLLIGKHGEAKTRCAEMIGKLLFDDPMADQPNRFQKIAADKVQFEDLVGFPNIVNGTVDYIPTPISIWERHMILIDELSRCTPQMMNKFLEIILERELMGIPTDIMWVWATMNPLEYTGSNPLDVALASRFGYVINIDPIIKQPDNVVKRVATMYSSAQTPALHYWGEVKEHNTIVPQELREEYRSMMKKSRELYDGLREMWINQVGDYVTVFCKSIANAGLQIDGRRITMITNNIIANIAIQTVSSKKSLNTAQVKVLVKDVVLLSLPWQATGINNFDASKVNAAHNLAANMLENGDSLLYRIITEQDATEKALLLVENRAIIDSSQATNLIASIYDTIPSNPDKYELWIEEAKLFALKLGLVQLFLNTGNFPSEAMSITVKNYPLMFSRLQRDDISNISFKNYREAVKIVEYYVELASSKSSINTAIGYFAFQNTADTLTLEDVKFRADSMRDAIINLSRRLRPFLKAKVTLNVSTNYNTSDLNISDCSDQGKSQEQQDLARTISTSGSKDSLDRLAAVI